MADLEHTALGSAQVHEPKHITTAGTGDAGKVITPDSSTAGTSILRVLDITELSSSGPVAAGTKFEADGSGGIRAGTAGGFAYGSVYIQGGSTATSISSSGTWTELATTDVVSGSVLNSITVNSGKPDVDVAGIYLVSANISFTSATATEAFRFAITVNGTPGVHQAGIESSAHGEEVNVSLSGIYSLAANDTLWLEVQNIDSSGNITVTYLNLVIHEIANA